MIIVITELVWKSNIFDSKYKCLFMLKVAVSVLGQQLLSKTSLWDNTFIVKTPCWHGKCWKCELFHWGWVTHICVDKLFTIGSDNGLSPDRRQAIIWTNAHFLSIGPLRTYFNKNLIKIQQFSLKKMHVEMSSAKWRPFVSASMC